jgi:hypothetical protein
MNLFEKQTAPYEHDFAPTCQHIKEGPTRLKHIPWISNSRFFVAGSFGEIRSPISATGRRLSYKKKQSPLAHSSSVQWWTVEDASMRGAYWSACSMRRQCNGFCNPRSRRTARKKCTGRRRLDKHVDGTISRYLGTTLTLITAARANLGHVPRNCLRDRSSPASA